MGKVVGENMEPNDYGRIVQECWLALPGHYPCCRLHEFTVMPNHVHGIIEIVRGSDVGQNFYVGEGFKPSRTLKPEELQPARLDKPALYTNPARSSSSHPASLSEILRGFKTFSARMINQKYPDGLFQWQRSFHDRVIRDKGELTAIGRYILENPRHWPDDDENLNVGAGFKPARS